VLDGFQPSAGEKKIRFAKSAQPVAPAPILNVIKAKSEEAVCTGVSETTFADAYQIG
jgi:hypothetical protein